MEIVLYSVTMRQNDLAPPPTGGGMSVEVQFRGEVSLMSPTFALTSAVDVDPYNYLYFPRWNRYYFIRNRSVAGNVTYLYTTEHCLTSWYETLMNNALYCVRSSNRVNEAITDTLFPSPTRMKTVTQSVPTPWLSIQEGNYIIGIASGGSTDSHIGTNSYYVLDTDQMAQFMSDLLNNADLSLSGVADSIVKTMINPLQYIQSCIWVPGNVEASTTQVNSINFGWWKSNVEARVLKLDNNLDSFTEYSVAFIPTPEMIESKREYLRYQPYSSIKFTAYPFGTIVLQKDLVTQYMDGYTLTARVRLDNITGMASLNLYANNISEPLQMMTAQVGIEIPVGQVLQDFAGSVFSAVGAVGALGAGSVLGATIGIKSAIDNLAPDIGVTGTAGGFAQLMLDKDWFLVRNYHTVEPETDLLGEPCCERYLLNALRGFAQFKEADVIGPMLEGEKAELKQLLESGVYIA